MFAETSAMDTEPDLSRYRPTGALTDVDLSGRECYRSAAHSLAAWLGLADVEQLAKLASRGRLRDAIEHRAHYHRERARVAAQSRLAGVVPPLSVADALAAMDARR